MRAELRRKIKQAILAELRTSSHAYQHTTDEQISERILDEIAVILDAGGYPAAPFDFDPLGGGLRGVGRCTCPAGKGTDPSCPVHP